MKTLAFILILTTLFTTIPCSAQSGLAAQAVIDARRDAEKDVNIILWTASGCCFSAITYTVAVTRTPDFPINRLIGKSPEYVLLYSQEYQRKTISLQSKYTLIGWVTGFVVVTLYYTIQDERPPFLP